MEQEYHDQQNIRLIKENKKISRIPRPQQLNIGSDEDTSLEILNDCKDQRSSINETYDD